MTNLPVLRLSQIHTTEYRVQITVILPNQIPTSGRTRSGDGDEEEDTRDDSGGGGRYQRS